MDVSDRVLSLPPRRRRPTATELVHGVFFLVAGWTVLAIAGEFVSGPYEASFELFPLAILFTGMVRMTHALSGGRSLVVAADLALAVLFGTELVFVGAAFRGPDEPTLIAAIVLGVVGAGLASRTPPARIGRIVRAQRDRLLLVLLVVIDAVLLGGAVVDDFGRPSPDAWSSVVQTVAIFVAIDGCLLVAWWVGSRWAVAISAAGNLVLAGWDGLTGSLVIDLGTLSLLIAVVAGFVGPRLVLARDAGGDGSATLESPGEEPRRRPTAATIWIGLGAVLWVPLVALGLFPPVLVDCFARCPQTSGFAVILTNLTIATFAVVPIAASIVLGRGPRDVLARRAAGILVIAAGLLGIDLATVLIGPGPFGYVIFGMPAAVLVGAGATIHLAPRRLSTGGGRIAALGGVALIFIWTWSVRTSYASESTLQLVAVVEAFAVAIALAWESSRAGRAASATSVTQSAAVA